MKLVILDRDGVINFDSDQYIKHPDEWRPIPGSLDAIARLTQESWRVVVATNQSGIGRGFNQAGGRIEAVFYCPDTAESQSACRKPSPGMFFAIAERLNVTLERVPAVGDSLRDLQAAAAVGAQPILVLTGKGRETHAAGELPEGTAVYPDLAAVAQALCQ